MRTHRKYLVLMLALILSAVTVLAGCGSGGSGGGGSEGSGEALTDIQQNVTVGKRVFVDKSGVVFFGYKNLICTALLKDGEITEFLPEGGTTGNINAMAVYNDELYISANDGLYKYPLSMFTSGESKASATTVLSKDDALSPFSHFEIFEDKIFFIYGSGLYYVPAGGGDKTQLAEDAVDFEVCDKGIYYTKANGDIMVMSPKLDDEKNIGNIGGVKFTPAGTRFYYRKDGKLMAYPVETEEPEAVTTGHEVGEYCMPFSNGKNVLYNDEGYNCYLTGADGEKEIGQTRNYPFKADGVVFGDYLISISSDCSIMEIVSLNDGTSKAYELGTEMKSYLDKMNGGGAGQDSNPEPPASSGDYNIAKGMAMEASNDGKAVYFFFNDFMITMPNKKYLGHLEEGDQVTFFDTDAEAAGFGGKLVTLKAYDLNDSSYENLPSYHVAGVCRNVNKRIVAIYPTDLQCDPNDSTQMANYKELFDYVQKIGEGAVNSPLQFADSD